jgi:hypothetical protein
MNMGSLMQLMALPAACMLFAWMGRGSVDAIASLLRNLVAMIAFGDSARARVVRGVAAPAKAVKAARAAAAPAAARRSPPKMDRMALPRTGIADPSLRMRRLRPRFAAASAGI